MKTVIFVYGTLMAGNRNHEYYLNNSRFIGKGTLKDYALYDLGYFPGIKPHSGDSVLGELYEVDAETLEQINSLEGEGSLYKLVYEPVLTEADTIVEAGVYVYLHNVDEHSYISSNDQPWRKRV